jgi:hypothetical protein
MSDIDVIEKIGKLLKVRLRPTQKSDYPDKWCYVLHGNRIVALG